MGAPVTRWEWTWRVVKKMAWHVPSGVPRRWLAETREAGQLIAITPGTSTSQAVAAPVPVLVSGWIGGRGRCHESPPMAPESDSPTLRTAPRLDTVRPARIEQDGRRAVAPASARQRRAHHQQRGATVGPGPSLAPATHVAW
jgi:hypothetical protein